MGKKKGKNKNLTLEEKLLHEKAVRQKEFWYTDPKTGYRVLTAYFLCHRGYCCRSGCRWCPYGFVEGEDWNEWNTSKTGEEE